jgi:AraC-like DNA-binding protein
MEITTKNVIELLAAFQAFLFAFYLLGAKDTKSKSTIYIAVFLILLGINTAYAYLEFIIYPISANLYTFLLMSFFLMPASLYLYTKSSIEPHFKLTGKSLVHLVPFIVINLVLIPTVYAENLKETPENSEFYQKLQIALYIVFYILLFLYQVLSFRLLHQNKQLYLENYSNTDIRRYRYLKTLNVIFTILFLISLAKNILVFNYEGPEADYATNIVKLSLLVLFCWIIYTGLRAPELFKASEITLPPVKDLLKMADQNSGNGTNREKLELVDEEKAGILDKVKNFMAEEEPYLDASLSLHDLSRQIKIPSRELSLAINHQLNKHFFDFVNEYRIEKAKQMLTDPDKKDFTVLEILYDVGFNSKSSFNTAFKKHTGFTPTQYRKSNSKSAA